MFCYGSEFWIWTEVYIDFLSFSSPPPEDEKIYPVKITADRQRGIKESRITWTNQRPPDQHRTGPENIIRKGISLFFYYQTQMLLHKQSCTPLFCV
jgi:hypothetical protein